MNAQTRESPVREFARLNLIIQRCRASNQPVPFEVQRRAQEIETWAHGTFTSAETQRLMQMVAAEQQNLLAEEGVELQQRADAEQYVASVRASAQQRYADALRNAGARQVSRVAGLHREQPLDERQMADAATRGKYTVTPKKRGDTANAKLSRALGREVPPEEVAKTMKHLGELNDNPGMMEKFLDANVGDDGVLRANMERRIRAAVLSHGLAERMDAADDKRGAFKPYEVTMTVDEKRRLDVADRVFAHEGGEAFLDRVHDRGAEGSIRAALVEAVESGPHPDEDVREAEREVNEIERIISEEQP
jgi:hypothetical protein